MNSRVHRYSLVRRPSRLTVPYIVLLAGLLATTAIAFYSNRLGRAREAIGFESATEQIKFTVASRIDTYVALLRATSGLFAASDSVTLPDFSRFVQRLDPRGRYPGIYGIGYSRRIAADELPSLVASMRARGFSDFRVWPSDRRAVYHSIIYLEPLDRRNRAAIGYDMFTEPV
ncbi:MAG: phytochrome-like protein cph1, partial [Acidobacteria bacterium]